MKLGHPVAATDPPVELLVTLHAAMGVVIEPMALADPPAMPPTCEKIVGPADDRYPTRFRVG